MYTRSTRKRLWRLLFLFLISSYALAEEKPCTIHDNGKYYDLNPLKRNKDYEFRSSSGQKIAINVCQSVKSELFGLKEDLDADDVGGFIRRAHGDFAIGKVNSTLTIFDSKPRFVISGGSRCKTSGDSTADIRASSFVEFTCDASIFGPGIPRLVAQLPPGEDDIGCAYIIEWRTHYACPTSEGSGIWGFFAILAIIFLVILLTYTVLGTLYNRYVLQLRGFDQIPQFSIESMKYHGREALDWMKDMYYALDRGGRGRAARMPLGGVSTNPVSHHSQSTGFAESENIEEGAFIRPHTSRIRPSQSQSTTNPVSHHTQANVERSSPFAAPVPLPKHMSQSPPAPLQQSSQPREFGLDINAPTEEPEFMLGDDDDAEELGHVTSPPPISPPPSVTPLTRVTSHKSADENPPQLLN